MGALEGAADGERAPSHADWVAWQAERARLQALADQLGNANELLERALSSSRVVWWEWNLTTGTFLTHASDWCLLGYNLPCMGQSVEVWMDLVHPDDLVEVNRSLAACMAGQIEEWVCEHRFKDNSGQWKWVLNRGRVVRRESAGRALRMVGTTQDIADRRAVQEELVRAKEAAEAASLAKSQFLAVMSHEIRTPLNPILGVTQLLLETSQDEDQRELLQMVFKAGSHLLTLLTDILDLAKIEAGRAALNPVSFRLDNVLSEAIEMRREEAKRRGLELRLDMGGGLGSSYRGDVQRLRQILLNLVGNGVKFTERGGVTLRVRAGPCTRPSPLGPYRQEFTFVVEDTGIGMDAAHLAHLFEPFYQADLTISRRYEGTGLGLSICHRLVEIMGGRITVASERGKGSTFTLTLPLEPEDDVAAAASATPAPEPAETAGRRPRILLVEDDASNRAVLSAMLRRLRCEILTAKNGREAVGRFAVEPVDLILMDLQMPVLDGFEATVEIRRSGARGQAVPIVAQTANAFSSDRESSLAVGMNDFLTKPVELAQLGRVLRKHLPTLA